MRIRIASELRADDFEALEGGPAGCSAFLSTL